MALMINGKRCHEYFSQNGTIPGFLQSYAASFENVVDLYHKVVAEHIKPGMTVLDAGCGAQSVLAEHKPLLKCSVGVDIAAESVKENSAFHISAVSNLENIPFKENTFDLIVSQFVAEHIEHPDLVFSEFHRILKKGGTLIIATNSIYNPIMFLSAVIPLGPRTFMKKRIWNEVTADHTFPTYYNCNSLGRMNRLLAAAGFKKEFDTYAGQPYCVALAKYAKVLLSMAFIFEKVTDIKFLRFLKMHLMVVYRK